MPKGGWPSMYVEDFLEGVASRSGRATEHRLGGYVKRDRAPFPFEDVQIPVVAASGKRVEPSRGQLKPTML